MRSPALNFLGRKFAFSKCSKPASNLPLVEAPFLAPEKVARRGCSCCRLGHWVEVGAQWLQALQRLSSVSSLSSSSASQVEDEVMSVERARMSSFRTVAGTTSAGFGVAKSQALVPSCNLLRSPLVWASFRCFAATHRGCWPFTKAQCQSSSTLSSSEDGLAFRCMP